MLKLNTCTWIIGVATVITLFVSCKKEDVSPGVASLMVMNAITDVNIAATNFRGDEYFDHLSRSLSLQFGQFNTNSHRLGLIGGETKLGLYAAPDTLVTSSPVFLKTYNFPVGSMHTLFFVGTKAAVEEVLISETYPFPGEEHTALRFINLSPDPQNVVFSVVGPATQPVSDALSYKSYSAFLPVPIQVGSPNYVVRCHDVTTNELIAELTLAGTGGDGKLTANTWLRNHFTIALVGVNGGDATFRKRLTLVSHTVN
jgi:hypothetical protein